MMSSKMLASMTTSGAVRRTSNSGSRLATPIKPSSGSITVATFPSRSRGTNRSVKSPPMVKGTPPKGIGPSTVKVKLITGFSSSLTRGVVVEIDTTGGRASTIASTRASPTSAPAKSGKLKAPANSGDSNKSASPRFKSSPSIPDTSAVAGIPKSNKIPKPRASSKVSATKKPLRRSEARAAL